MIFLKYNDILIINDKLCFYSNIFTHYQIINNQIKLLWEQYDIELVYEILGTIRMT